jgi:hypothetical protein
MPETATPPLTTPWTYRVTILENDRLAEVRLQAGRSIRKLFPRVTPTSEEQSLTSALSRAILEHYFQATAGDSRETAHTKAFEHRTALSHVLGTKLKEGRGTLTDSEVANALFGLTLNPPKDPWVARYSVPSDSNPDKYYTVAKKQDGTWACPCWPWKRTRTDCKHIQRAQQRPDWYPYRPPTAD